MSGFSERFRLLRDSRGLTQTQIADILGISRETIAGYEGNKKRVPRGPTLNKIADYFNTTTDYLLFGREKENNEPEKMDPIKKELFEVIKDIDDDADIGSLLHVAKQMKKSQGSS